MFGKKLLSILGLLSSAYAVTITWDNGSTCESSGGVNDQIYAIFSSTENGNYEYDSTYATTNFGKIVRISEDASCTLIDDIGYFMSADLKYFKRDSTGAVTKLDDLLTTCTASGDLGTGGNLCITDDDAGSIVFGTGEQHFITDGKGVFSGTATNKVVVNSNTNSFTLDKTVTGGEYCISDAGVVGALVTTENERLNKFCTGNCTIYKCNLGVCTTDLDPHCRKAGAPTCDPTTTKAINSESNEEACTANAYYLRGNDIYRCSGVTVSCQKLEGAQIPRGYFVNTGVEDSYISCDGITCDEVTKYSITAENCTLKKPGDLIFYNSNYRICNEGRTALPADIDNGYKYIIKAGTDYGSKHPFNALTQNTSYMVTVESDVSSGFNIVVGEKVSVGNYVVDADSKIITESGVATLIQCTSEAGNCATPSSLPVGFLRNALYVENDDVPYIKCQSGSCTAVLPGDAANCGGKKAGEIVKIGANFNICIEDGIAVLLTGSTPIKYMVKIASEYTDVSPFSTLVGGDATLNGKYVMVDVGTDATLHAQESKKYRYANAKQRIYNSSLEEGAKLEGGICTNTGNKITEFTIDVCSGDTNDYYSKGDSITWGVN